MMSFFLPRKTDSSPTKRPQTQNRGGILVCQPLKPFRDRFFFALVTFGDVPTVWCGCGKVIVFVHTVHTHTIHVSMNIYIAIHEWLIFYGKLVGKSTVRPMDVMGYVFHHAFWTHANPLEVSECLHHTLCIAGRGVDGGMDVLVSSLGIYSL